MSKPNLTYNKLTNTFHDADGHVLVALPIPGASVPDLTTAQHSVAEAFGYSTEDAPDILRVGSGTTSEEDTPSQAHRDIAEAFVVERESGV